MSRDPAKSTALGTQTVCAALGIADMTKLIPPPGLSLAATEILRIAYRVDHVNKELIGLAASAARDLQHLADGLDNPLHATHGVLGHTGVRIDLLAARRSELMEQLPTLIRLYQQAAASAAPATTPVAVAAEERRNAARATPSRVRPPSLSETQQQALIAIGRGNAQLWSSIRGGRLSVTSQGPERIRPSTVDVLVERKLVLRDTSTSWISGQRLSLTPDGEKLRDTIVAKRGATSAAAEVNRSPGATDRPGTERHL